MPIAARKRCAAPGIGEALSPHRRLCSLPIGEESINAAVSKRMLQHLSQYFEGNGCDMRSGGSDGGDVSWSPDARCDHLGWHVVAVEKVDSFANQVGAIVVDVIQTSDKGTDESGASVSDEQRLVHAEY